MKLSLRDVTVCAADTVSPELAARALELCLDRCDFADAILFSDRPVAGRFRNVAVPTMNSIDAYSHFCLAGMPHHVTTDFALVVQWDGYVVHPHEWTDAFRDYDYIGAPFAIRDVLVMGNGGFSWRSRKLLEAVASLPPQPGRPEDMVISRDQRPHFEADLGMRYAPNEMAFHFAHDGRRPPFSTFGFHGARNFLLYENANAVIDIFERAAPGVFNTQSVMSLILKASSDAKTLAAGVALYRIARRHFTENHLAKAMARHWAPERARANIAVLEQYLRRQNAGLALS